MEIGGKFKDILYYNKNMAKSMEDKMFFTSMLPTSNEYIFVDFGCADGVMINALNEHYTQSYFFGYDISDSMIELAKSRIMDEDRNFGIYFTTDWNEIVRKIYKINSHKGNRKVVLILSSVIHEIYSYAEGEDDINKFWSMITDSIPFDYICVRDMMYSNDLDRRCTSINDLFIFKHINQRQYWPINKISTFERLWTDYFNGVASDNMKDLVQFLLKYKWVINWERELKENYFPISVEDFLKKMTKNFNIKYLERFRVPYLDDCFRKDFDIELEDNTHIKAIFERKRK